MKRFIKTALTVVLAAAAVSCAKEIEPQKEKINGTFDLSVTGVINGYTPQEETKAEAQTVVRIMWKGGEKVYVFDGTKCLGSLTASIEDTDGTYAKLTGTIDATAATTLTFVYSPQFSETQAPDVPEGKISLDLSTQDGEEVPFLIYATLPTAQAPTSFSNDVVQFNLATSVFKCNCAGLVGEGEISQAAISGVNTKCELTLSDSGAPEVSGTTPGTITRTAGFTQADQRAIFSVALPKTDAPAAPAERTILVFQDSKVSGAPFNSATIDVSKSYNTVNLLDEYVPDGFGGYVPAVKSKCVTLNESKITIMVDTKYTLAATVAPANATYKQINWSSSDETVATIDQNGLVTAVSEGSTNVFATTAKGNFFAVCMVTVVPPYVEIAAKYDGQNISILKWYRNNIAFSTSGIKAWKGANTSSAVRVPGTNNDVIVGDYFQWAASYAGYNITEDADKKPENLLIYTEFTNKGCGDKENKVTFKSAGSGKTYQFYTGTSGNNVGMPPYYSGSKYTKYTSGNPNLNRTPEDNDDVANIILGGDWRIPTGNEFNEMRNATYWAWDGTDQGYYIFKPGQGTNGAAGGGGTITDTDIKAEALLFFPAAGLGKQTGIINVGSDGYYWSSTLYNSGRAYISDFNSKTIMPHNDSYRYYGRTVRSVSY